ncbi:MAG: hypothetical protein HN416_16945, partial [Nitrospina sp.]|nr:hypothetical protein [Nitrospina sp.]
NCTLTYIPNNDNKESLTPYTERNAVILSGGDKKGKDQEKFYKKLISKAETIFEKHLNKILRKKG